MNGNRAEAEEAYSAAMLRACEAVHAQAPHVSSAKAWLGAVLRNVCVDAHRRRQRFHDDTTEDEEPMDRIATLESTAPSPEALVLREEVECSVWERVHALPPPLREPFVMRFLHDMSYGDIAGQLGLTNCNVRKRVQLAYRALRTTLADLRPDSRHETHGIHNEQAEAS